MDRIKCNPTMPFSEPDTTIPAPTKGTVGGVTESMEVVQIPNVGKTIDAPKNSPAGWSAGADDLK